VHIAIDRADTGEKNLDQTRLLKQKSSEHIYIPAYRSPAGTGVGMAYAAWNRDRSARTEQETAAR
jgi:hypothetical protein